MIQEFPKKKKKQQRKIVLKSAKKLFDARDDIIDLFEKGTFPYKENVFKTKKESKKESKKERSKKIFKYIEDESKGINYDLFKEYFDFKLPTVLAKNYMRQKMKKKKDLVELIQIKWSNLKDEIEKMSKDETEAKKPDKILEIVEEIVKFND